MVTFAAATTPPVVSVIVPWMFPVATVLCAYSGTTAPTRIKAMKTTDTTILTFVEVPRSMLSHPREQNECSRIKFTTLRKRYTCGFVRSTGLQRTDGRFYLLVEIECARLFDILLWSSELAAKRSVFRSEKAARASS
jgi:hypothetical protein